MRVGPGFDLGLTCFVEVPMLTWLWRNKEWFFQGAGVALVAVLAKWLAAVGLRAYRRWQIERAFGGGLQNVRNAVIAGAVVTAVFLSAVLVVVAWQRAGRSGVNSAGADTQPSFAPSSFRVVDAAGRPVPFVRVGVLQEGVEFCSGRTGIAGRLACIAAPGDYDVSVEVSGVAFRQRVNVPDEPATVDIEVIPAWSH